MTKRDEKSKKNKNKSLKNWAALSGIAIQMIVIIGVGTFVGVQLDNYFSFQDPIFTASLSLLSVLIAMFYVIRQILNISNNNDR